MFLFSFVPDFCDCCFGRGVIRSHLDTVRSPTRLTVPESLCVRSFGVVSMTSDFVSDPDRLEYLKLALQATRKPCISCERSYLCLSDEGVAVGVSSWVIDWFNERIVGRQVLCTACGCLLLVAAAAYCCCYCCCFSHRCCCCCCCCCCSCFLLDIVVNVLFTFSFYQLFGSDCCSTILEVFWCLSFYGALLHERYQQKIRQLRVLPIKLMLELASCAVARSCICEGVGGLD